MRTLVVCLTASAALNTLAFISVDQAFLYQGKARQILLEQKMRQQESGVFPIEYVEAPALVKPQKPVKARRVSDRDSVLRDSSRSVDRTASSPKIEKKGPSDQLAQARPKPVATPVQASAPQKAAQAMDAAPPASEPKPKQPQKVAEDPGAIAPEEPSIQAPQQEKSPQAQQSSKAQAPSPAQEPRSGKKEASGVDRIIAQAMTRSKSAGGARLSGTTSFDAMGSDVGIYMKNLKEKIWLAWYPYLAFQYPNDFRAADALLQITLSPEGEVKQVKVLSSYGSPVFTTFCAEAIQRASGFGPIPKEILALLGKEVLEIQFAFHYR